MLIQWVEIIKHGITDVTSSPNCAGMAGLSCGYHLQKAGVRFAIVESSDSVGGRVQTDNVDGFLLDRGFQIFLTSYQEAQAMLDYQSLDLKPFYAGEPAVDLGCAEQ